MRREEREHALMRAVLVDAVHCLLGGVRAPGRDRQALARQAWQWVTESNTTAPLGFEEVCHALDLDPGALRRRLLALVDHAAGDDAAGANDVHPALAELVDVGLLRATREPPERRRWSKAERNAEMIRLRQAGWSLRALAQRFAVSVSRACTICMQAERAGAAQGVSASRRSATRSDAPAQPSAAGSPVPASRSERRPPSPGRAAAAPGRGTDTPPEPREARAEP
jgi:hypothetical protein